MDKPLYLVDSYLKEFDAVVVFVHGSDVILDRTAFYPASGGQPNDLGMIICNGKEYVVNNVRKSEQGIVHETAGPGLCPNDRVHCVLNWERRCKLMRMHTAAHVLSAVVNRMAGALITGNQLNLDKSRIDFSLEEFDKGKIQKFADEANRLISAGAAVETRFMPREEALKLPGIVKLADKLPPNVSELRIVDIKGFDAQACGGTHVKELSEIGKIIVLGAENKGKSNRRMYFTLE
jgi:misacylated tRNA(Ala) deacylase